MKSVEPDLWQGKSVLVTGGAGFIGSHLVETLAGFGAVVRVLDDLSSGHKANLEPAMAKGRVELRVGDIRDLDTCHSACLGQAVVFHQAARGSVPRSLEDPATTIAVNVMGTANVLTAARDAAVERTVYASSSSVYGDSDVLPKREGEEGQPLSPYALSKVMNEQLAGVFGSCFGLECIGLRYFNVYGPRQDPEGPYAAVIPRFLKACLAGRRPLVFGDGAQSRDFTFVGDAVAANLLAGQASSSSCGRAYNVGSGRRSTILELAEKIGALTSAPSGVDFQPPREGDVLHSCADLRRVAELGYRPGTTLEEGLAATHQGSSTFSSEADS